MRAMRDRASRGGRWPVLVGWSAAGRSIAVGLAAALLIACQATASQGPKAAPVPTPPAALASPVEGQSAAGPNPPSDPVKRGELIFQETAGGFGCQFCHGKDAKGLVGPNIRGKAASAIKNALANIEAMRIITVRTPLLPEDIEAVEKYLGSLGEP